MGSCAVGVRDRRTKEGEMKEERGREAEKEGVKERQRWRQRQTGTERQRWRHGAREGKERAESGK